VGSGGGGYYKQEKFNYKGEFSIGSRYQNKVGMINIHHHSRKGPPPKSQKKKKIGNREQSL